jgi:hypothetical protein
MIDETGVRAFSAGGYEIFDEGFAIHGEVAIWSKAPPVPQVGDRFLIDTLGRTHELAVREVRTFAGGWSAICRT